ncbi:transposase [Nocardia sp. NPDC059246]|uniref:transposase n=1 Tax=unclassified Nocardia TaxID=2637762 RepID=UPI0036B8544B
MASAIGDRYRVLTDKQWELLELLLPKSEGRMGRNFSNNLVVEGMLYRLRTSLPWRALPEEFGRGKRCGNATAATPLTVPGTGC